MNRLVEFPTPELDAMYDVSREARDHLRPLRRVGARQWRNGVPGLQAHGHRDWRQVRRVLADTGDAMNSIPEDIAAFAIGFVCGLLTCFFGAQLLWRPR